MKDCFWSLYNSVDDTRVDGLRTVQLRSLMRTIARGGLDEWLVWEEGTTDWRRAGEVVSMFTSSEEPLHSLKPVPPPLAPEAAAAAAAAAATKAPASPEKSMLFHETPEESSKVKKGPVDERSSPRFLINLRVFIHLSKGRVVSNTTVNVSVGGMKLENPLPEGVSGSFDVTLMKGNVELSMRCRTLKAEQETEVTRLLIEHCNRMDLLRQWLARDQNEAIS